LTTRKLKGQLADERMRTVILITLLQIGSLMAAINCPNFTDMIDCCQDGYDMACEWQNGTCEASNDFRITCECIFWDSCESCGQTMANCNWNGTLCLPVGHQESHAANCPSYYEQEREGQIATILFIILPFLALFNLILFCYFCITCNGGPNGIAVRIVN
jgi:hypothetical protein